MPRDLFAAAFDTITFDDVRDIASTNVEESPRLEFKEALSTRDGQPDRWMVDQKRIGTQARDDIAKEIVAFTNAYGGVIIIGIEETDDNPKRSKQIHSPMIPRVVDCAEQLAQSLRGIIDPPLPMLEARGIVATTNGEGVIVLRVPSSPSAPHGLGRPPMAYVRREANSEPLSMRDMQTMFFERRTRLERVERRRQDQSSAARELLSRWMRGGLLKPHDQKPFAPNQDGLLIRCSLVPLEDMAIDNMPDRFLGRQEFSPRPGLTERSLVELPAWTQNWSRSYRAVEYLYAGGDIRYSSAAIHADGLIQLLGIRADPTGTVYVAPCAHVIAQGMMLCEWMRRWAGRPDIEYSLDGEIMLRGPARVCVDRDFDEWKPVAWTSGAWGPYSIGSRAGFATAFDVIERELWDLFGIRRMSPLKFSFEELFAELFKNQIPPH